MEEAFEGAASTPGDATHAAGFGDLDRLTSGDRGGQVWSLSGPTGMGKSVLALGFARATARLGTRAVVLDRHEGPDVFALRVLTSEGRVPLHHMTSGSLSADDSHRLSQVTSALRRLPLEYAQGPLPWLLQELGAGEGPLLLVVDSISEHEELLDLIGFARERSAWVVVVLDPMARLRKRARGLCWVSLDLVREDYDDRESPRAGEADLVVTRHRGGPVGTITVAFQGHYGRFVDFVKSP